MSVVNDFKQIIKDKGCCFLALIDPDGKSHNQILRIVKKINSSNFHAILVGGSTLNYNEFASAIQFIRSNTLLKIIIFPSSSLHVSKFADAILFTSLLTSKHREYLIGKQLKSSISIYNSFLEVIPTGYIHIDGGNISSIEKVTNSKPIDWNDYELVLSYCLLSQHFGHKYVYLEAGSGAINNISSILVKKLAAKIKIPIIVGGGITSKEDVEEYSNSGVSFLVIGNLLESAININELNQLTQVPFNHE